MIETHRKCARVRLDPIACQNLRQLVLRRDGWRCQLCGTMSNLEVHHQQFRSHSGDDSEQNLVTLCRTCHNEIHNNVSLIRKSHTVPD